MKFKTFTTETLEKVNLFVHREIGRVIGVRAPAAKNKDELIKEIIAVQRGELEPAPRGIYGGAIGYFSCTGNLDLAITIRTIEMRNGEIAVQAGAGIVYDSVPELEYSETLNKAAALFKAVELAANGLEL